MSKDILNLSSSEIIDIKHPESLFTGDLIKVKKEFISLAEKWHPDKSCTSSSVFSHISFLYHKALEKLDEGTWEGKGSCQFMGVDGYVHNIDFIISGEFQLGRFYLDVDKVYYLLDTPYISSSENHLDIFDHFVFADDSMTREITSYLPTNIEFFPLEGFKGLYVFPRRKKYLRVRDVFNYYKGKIHWRHVAWILSSLYNLACYLEYIGVVHNDISMDNYYIEPEAHNGQLLGGWFYSVLAGEFVPFLPRRTYNIYSEGKLSKKASHKFDLESISLLGKELLGDSRGVNIDCPSAMKDWLNFIPVGSSVDCYEKWNQEVLPACGPREYHKMNLSYDVLYNI